MLHVIDLELQSGITWVVWDGLYYIKLVRTKGLNYGPSGFEEWWHLKSEFLFLYGSIRDRL